MPIDTTKINQTDFTTTQLAVTPKFFSPKLTGSGKKVGIINHTLDPKNTISQSKQNLANLISSGYTTSFTSDDGLKSYTFIPLTPNTDEGDFKKFDFAELSEYRKAKLVPIDNDTDYCMCLVPRLVTIEEIFYMDAATGSRKKAETNSLCKWRLFVFNHKTKGDEYEFLATRDILDPSDIESHIKKWAPPHMADKAVEAAKAFVDSISCYDSIVYAAKSIINHAHVMTENTVTHIIDTYASPRSKARGMAKHFYKLEEFAIPLEEYSKIYDVVDKRIIIGEGVSPTIFNCNANLMLTRVLRELEAVHATLTPIPIVTPEPQVDPKLSFEQKAAVTTHETLSLVQSAAGTGKSTVIKHRIAYLKACGIDPKDILVLSFTNAAADHIKAIEPSVISATIATMINTIYSVNYTHQISSEETLANTLDVVCKHDKCAYTLAEILRLNIEGPGCTRGSSMTKLGAIINLFEFVNKNITDVIRVLDKVSQTTLLLQSIIAYNLIDTLKEPTSIASKHIIIDEVQDTSTFEFAYILKYATKHKESVFMVGDSSQTLYEFRNANPKAINALENSGIFTTFKLQTNYRSRAEILNFANITLANIESNRFANLRLVPNSNRMPTPQSLEEKVTINFNPCASGRQFMRYKFEDVLRDEAKEYIDACLAHDEKVTFLAYARANVAEAQKILETMYPNKVGSLVPKHIYDNTIFSRFIKKGWHYVTFAPTNQIYNTIYERIMEHLDEYTYKPTEKKRYKIFNYIQDWITKDGPALKKLQADYIAKRITYDKFMQSIQNDMLNFEMRNNSVRQRMEQNNRANESTQDIIDKYPITVCTIHSAKGLEFDNTIVLFDANNTITEEAKRMFYVAFTRAINSEYIIAYANVGNPAILGAYEDLKESYDTTIPDDALTTDDTI